MKRCLWTLLFLSWAAEALGCDSTIVAFAVGNKYAFAGTRHIHGVPDYTPISYCTEIIADTVVDGRRYFRFTGAGFPWSVLQVFDDAPLFRADSASIYRYRIAAAQEDTIVNFSDPVGTVYSSGAAVVWKGQWPVFSDSYSVVRTQQLRFANRLFLVWFETVGTVQEVVDLKGAKIGGVFLGDVELVSAGTPLSAASDLRDYVLQQNYPNPFNPSTTIRYSLPRRSHVNLTVFNTLGQQVVQLVNGEMETGHHEVRFDGTGLSSGVYLYRMQAGDFVQTRRMLVVR